MKTHLSSDVFIDSRRLLVTMNQRIQKNCTHQIVISAEDFEKRGDTLRLTSETQERILGEYRIDLEESKKSIAEKISLIGGQMGLIQSQKQTLSQYLGNERKHINSILRSAEKNWKSVDGEKGNPEHDRFFREYQTAKALYDKMIATDIGISSIEETLGVLLNQKTALQKDFKELAVDTLCEILSQELEPIHK